MKPRELHWQAGDQEISCRIDDEVFHVGGESLPFRVIDSTHIEISGKRHRFYVIRDRDSLTVWLDGRTYHLKPARKIRDAGDQAQTGTGEIRALMPGKLLRLDVAVGDTVAPKQTVAIMESMKMESALVAPAAGRVSEIRFKAGDVIEIGQIVIVIEQAA